MKRTLPLCLLAGLMALCLVKAAASPVVGTWDGTKDGVKAATITVRETDGILGGTAIFYIIIREEGSGSHNGAATPPLAMVGTQWDGKVLRFSVTNDDGKSIAFEFRVTGEGKAELRRPAQNGEEEIKVPMLRAR
jgi:hypothetical protein